MEKNEVDHGAAPDDDKDFADASASNLEALLAGDALDDEENSENVPDDSNDDSEPDNTGQAEEIEEEQEEKDEYYSEEEVLELSKDLDNTKFDRKKVRPGSLVDKTLKNLERGYNKKYEGFANDKKKLQQQIAENSELIALRNEVSNLKNQPNQIESYFEKQRRIDEEKKLSEEEALLEPEEREFRQKSRETQREMAKLKQQLAENNATISKMSNENRNKQINSDIEKAITDNNLSKKDHIDRIKYAIGNQWEKDNQKRVPLTPVADIVKELSVTIKDNEKNYYSEDKLDDFFNTPEGKKLVEKQIKAKLDKLRKMKSTGKVVSSSTTGKVPINDDNNGIDINKVDRSNLLAFLGGDTVGE